MFRAPFVCVLLIVASMCGLCAQSAEEDIRGPKDLIEIPIPQEPPILLWTYIIGGFVVTAIIVILWKTRVRRKHLNSPSQIALAALTELERSPNPLAAEAFANHAAQTIRQYIATSFGLAAPRQTTEEFLRDLALAKDLPVSIECDHLKSFLKSCDLAKFAGSNLNSTQRDELIEAARRFIDATSKPITP